MSVHVQVMLTGEMKESREGRVDLKGVSGKGLKVVVDFAYTGRWLLLKMINQFHSSLAMTHC